ncbi:MAG: hypothetical protein ACK47B_12720 [Armatimonadota bacterium]
MLHVLVLRDEECASCDEVREELDGLKSEFPEMRIRERVLDQEPELAGRLGVVATPAVVVNNQLAFQGHPERDFLVNYLRNVQAGLHDDPTAYPPDDERDPEARGQEATGSQDAAWRGSGRRPSFGSSPGGRH